MKKLGILLLVLAILGGGYYYVTQDKLADWKTYQNTQFGFDFKHPADFLTCDVSNFRGGSLSLGLYKAPNCDITRTDPPEIGIFIVDAVTNKSVQDLFLEEFPRARDAENYSSIKTFKLGGLDAYGGEMKFKQEFSEYGIIVFIGNDRLMIIKSPFYIYPLPGQKVSNVTTKPAIDGIISTLEFN